MRVFIGNQKTLTLKDMKGLINTGGGGGEDFGAGDGVIVNVRKGVMSSVSLDTRGRW